MGVQFQEEKMLYIALTFTSTTICGAASPQWRKRLGQNRRLEKSAAMLGKL
jgi:hypothetical protein